jgi:predicted PurR-regulated permease PerM
MSRSWKVAFLATIAVAAIVFAYFLRAVFMPLIVALLLAYILNPIITALEKRKVPRLVSIIGVYLVLLCALVGLFVWAIPAGATQAREFVRETFTAENAKAQRVILWGDKQLKDWLGAENWDHAVKNLREKMKGHEGELAQAGGAIVAWVIAFMTSSIGGFVAVFSFVALVPVYLFFLLKNMNPWWDKLTHAIPRMYRDPALATLARIHRANASFFRGQITISLIEGVIVFLVLSLLGVKFSLLFGALYAMLSVIPFLGVVIGFTVTELFVLADTGTFGKTFALVAALYLGIQVLEGVLLQPAIMGKETGLHPIAIILALLLCGQLFGIFGMLIAVPIASTVKILLEDYVWPMFREVAELTKVRIRPPEIHPTKNPD